MKKYKELVQGSEEWKELRHGKVGGSTAKDLMVKIEKPIIESAGFLEIFSEKMEDFDPFKSEFVSFAMQRGVDLEPEARSEYERITGIKMEEYGWVELNNLVGISPDGWNEKLKKGLEIKCPEAKTYTKYLLNFDEFLSDYVWQLVHYFVVLDIENLDCVAYRPENQLQKIIIKTITLDTKIKISAKVTLPVSELKKMLEKRLLELQETLDIELNKLTFNF